MMRSSSTPITAVGPARLTYLCLSPNALFDGFGATSHVYAFANHGGYSAPGFDTASGFGEWASMKTVLPS